jgi:hypothetical protein
MKPAGCGGIVRLVVGALLIVVAAMPASGAAGAPGAPRQDTDRPNRVLVFSVPGLTWADLQELDLPAIEGFAAESAVGALVPRSVFHRSDAGDAYLTISAGTRAAGVDGVDGEVLRTVEDPAEGNVGEVFQRRTGITVGDGSVVLGWPELIRRNAREPFDADLGQLHDSLSIGGVATMVVGNADGSDEVGAEFDRGIQRQVGLALVDRRGVVEGGQLGTDLLSVDPAWPFGLRLDRERVLAAFGAGWSAPTPGQRLVAMVEASDVVRAMRYEPLVTDEHADQLRLQALQEADALFADLLEQVGPGDAVLLLAPYNANRRLGLTVTALRTDETASGYVRSASTQRAGFVSLVDVAPTILDLLDIQAPTSMEGRPFEVVADGATLAERTDHLVSVNAASRFRENLLTPTTIAIVAGMVAVVCLTAAALAGRWSATASARVRFGALTVLCLFPMSYVARAFPLEDLGLAFYWPFLLVSSLAMAGVATVVAARRGDDRLALGLALALVGAVLLGDVTTGSHLSLNSAFGYSPTGNSRLYGISNYSYGQVAGAACLVAALVAAWMPTRRGRWLSVGVLLAVLVVLGVPVWGSDVGGVLAFTPAIGAFALLLYGLRVRVRTVALAGVATAAVIVVFGFLDLSRPPTERAHLGRLFERIGREGLEPLVSVVERKLLANLRVSTGSAWVLAIPIAVGFWVFLARHRSHGLARIARRIPTLQAGLVAAAVAAVLGSLLNDSGAIIGGIVLTVVAVALAFLALDPGLPVPAGEEPT